MEKIHYIENIFGGEEIKSLALTIKNSELKEHSTLGRIEKQIDPSKNQFLAKLTETVSQLFEKDLILGPITYVKYSSEYGEPNLPPHIDRDKVEVIVDYQYNSNTQWDLALNKTIYKIEDNSALMFNPNKNIHWRPIKIFQTGEYVEMIFFRFFEIKDGEIISDYTNIVPKEGEYNPEILEARNYREMCYNGSYDRLKDHTML